MSEGGDCHVRIVLAGEQGLFQDAMREALDAEPDLHVVAQVRNVEQAALEAARSMADVALVAAEPPGCDGACAAPFIRERAPGCRVVVVAPDHDLEILLTSLEAGAAGLVLKTETLRELTEATRAVYAGDTYLPRKMIGNLITQLLPRRKERDEAFKRVRLLTNREREILLLLAEGNGNEEIARAAVISPQTARTHIQNVLAKLGVHSRLQAVAFVIQNGVREELAPAGK